MLKKKFYLFLFFLLLIQSENVLGYSLNCNTPLPYSIGKLDLRFEISKSEFLTEIKKAERLWEIAVKKDLFVYDPNAKFKINLIFDQRQNRTVQSRILDSTLAKLSDKKSQLGETYKIKYKSFMIKEKQYNELLNQYNAKLKKHNQRVLYWNSKKGATESIYNEIKDDEKYLDRFAKKLSLKQDDLNTDIREINRLTQEINFYVKQHNNGIETFKSRYGHSRKFNQGLYDGESISIYQFEDKNDLVLALTHEMGHARGIDHINDSKGVMYYLMNEQNIENPSLSNGDIKALLKVCEEHRF